MKLAAAAFAAILWSGCASARTSMAPPSIATEGKTVSGATFTVPAEWRLLKGTSMVILAAPETDLRGDRRRAARR